MRLAVTFQHNACDLSIRGVLKKTSSNPDLQMGRKCPIEEYPDFYYTLVENGNAEEIPAQQSTI